MSSIVIKGNTSGQVEIAAPDVAGSTTLTLPTGNVDFITTGNLASNENNIKMVDAWRLTTDIVGGGSFVLTSGFSPTNSGSDGFVPLGSRLTESSGQFSFPQTGIYQIIFQATFVNAGSDTTSAIYLNYTGNNFTSYSNVIGLNAGQGSGGSIASCPCGSCIFNITDIANEKFHFSVSSLNSTIASNTGINITGFTVVRLGEASV